MSAFEMRKQNFITFLPGTNPIYLKFTRFNITYTCPYAYSPVHCKSMNMKMPGGKRGFAYLVDCQLPVKMHMTYFHSAQSFLIGVFISNVLLQVLFKMLKKHPFISD